MEEFEKIPKEDLPKHVGLILDGNRRWAREKKNNINLGHKAGYNTVIEVLPLFFDAGIRYLSIYTLSLDNFKKRNKEELEFLYALLKIAIDHVKNDPIVTEKKVRFNVLGRIHLLPPDIQEKFKELTDLTKAHDNAFVNVCIMYDGQAEIVDAVKAIIEEGIPAEKIDEKTIKDHLYTADFPEVDYIIRTGMEDGARISGFLLWDSSYAEFKFRKEYWPDYNLQMLIEDLQDFAKRNRRKGK